MSAYAWCAVERRWRYIGHPCRATRPAPERAPGGAHSRAQGPTRALGAPYRPAEGAFPPTSIPRRAE